MTFSQLLVKACRNKEEETTSKVVNKNAIVENDSILEQRVDRLIVKSNINQNLPNIPNRDNSRNYGLPPFHTNRQPREDYQNGQLPRCPQRDI